MGSRSESESWAAQRGSRGGFEHIGSCNCAELRSLRCGSGTQIFAERAGVSKSRGCADVFGAYISGHGQSGRSVVILVTWEQ